MKHEAELEERIKKLHEEIDAVVAKYVDERAAASARCASRFCREFDPRAGRWMSVRGVSTCSGKTRSRKKVGR